ncbi:MAG: hypothetical protein H7A51_19255 [Akkermansiaceae bacterium]|nr:hypothetical protein [Akkermansiaceae bacterium]
MWFEQLTGFTETSPVDVRQQLELSDTKIKSSVNGRSWECGTLEIVKLGDLRKRIESIATNSPLRVTEDVANVQELHANPANSGALFQVASQFNLLEMVSPAVTPEQGVGIYENDYTQGPACAIAAGAGTIYRNYFAKTNGEIGQSASNQIDCLADLGKALQNTDERLWKMRNGYALASADGLDEISRRLQESTKDELDKLRGHLKVGLQWDTQVTLGDCSHLVSQTYCSALPVAYSSHCSEMWRDFAVLILEAAYEATLCAAILNAQKTGNNKVFLTLLGGGAFGNESVWIIDAIDRALRIHADSGLDVRIVSFRSSNRALKKLIG